TSFSNNVPLNVPVGTGDLIYQIDVPATSNFVASDITVALNITYAGDTSNLRIRLRAPDGSEIDLASAGILTGNTNLVNTVFDDQSQIALNSINANTGVRFASPFTNTFQSSSFSQTIQSGPTTTSPFGLGFYRGKNVSGTWAIV